MLPSLTGVQDGFHFLRGKSAVMAVKILFELILFIPPDRLIAVRQNHQIPNTFQKTGGYFFAKIAICNQGFCFNYIGPAFQSSGKKVLRFIQEPILNVEEHVTGRASRDDQPVFAILPDQALNAVKFWVGVEEDRGLWVDLAHAVVGSHQEQDSLFAIKDGFEIMLHH